MCTIMLHNDKIMCRCVCMCMYVCVHMYVCAYVCVRVHMKSAWNCICNKTSVHSQICQER
jgi:hypothetical protein